MPARWPYSTKLLLGGSAGLASGDTASGLAGDSTIQVIVTDSHGCADTSSGVIGNSGFPSGTISGPDTICFKESNGRLIVTPTSNDGPYTYLWSNGSTTQAAGGLAVGSYTCTIFNAHHCPVVLNGEVLHYDTAIGMVESAAVLYLGQTEQVTVLTSVVVKDAIWEPYVPGSRGQTTIYDKPTKDTTVYWVTVYYGQSCTLRDSVAIYVFPDTVRITVPNTFTPNGDGLNDEYYLQYNIPPLQDFHIWIYDRWGNKVYESTDRDFHWKGVDIFTGNTPLNSGVFAYLIEYRTFDSKEVKRIDGNITLVK